MLALGSYFYRVGQTKGTGKEPIFTPWGKVRVYDFAAVVFGFKRES